MFDAWFASDTCTMHVVHEEFYSGVCRPDRVEEEEDDEREDL